MKSKLFMILTIIALAGIVVAFNSSPVWAQQQGPEDMRRPGFVPVEFSDTLDKRAVPPGGAISLPDSEQVLFTIPVDAPGAPYPKNSIFDFGVDQQVDALANIGDAYFRELIRDLAPVYLLVSFSGDPVANTAWWEQAVTGLTGVQWTQVNLNNPNLAPPDTGKLDDLDAVETWGPHYSDDANCYSLIGDPIHAGSVVKYSVFRWWWRATNPYSIPYVPHSDIVAAVQALGYTGAEEDVDLDGLMVWGGGGGFDTLWNAGDTIVFSIRASGNWDGGEIVVLPFTGRPASATFLTHGGHLWNTAFAVGTTFGVPTEEVDAIEDVVRPTPQFPTMTEWGLIVFAGLFILALIFVLRRRRVKVPTPA